MRLHRYAWIRSRRASVVWIVLWIMGTEKSVRRGKGNYHFCLKNGKMEEELGRPVRRPARQTRGESGWTRAVWVDNGKTHIRRDSHKVDVSNWLVLCGVAEKVGAEGKGKRKSHHHSQDIRHLHYNCLLTCLLPQSECKFSESRVPSYSSFYLLCLLQCLVCCSYSVNC